MKRFYDAFKARMARLGRPPEACKLFFLVKPIIGDTDEAAQQTADALYANAPVEAGLAALSTLLQIDLSTLVLIARVADPIAPLLATVLVLSPYSTRRSRCFSSER
jgi:alkanesulfonate monooxygenase SsuD/methylene tetrahydromethanopterin reductase-like flavin-dependent oxidoreductase (luciferase family)